MINFNEYYEQLDMNLRVTIQEKLIENFSITIMSKTLM